MRSPSDCLSDECQVYRISLCFCYPNARQSELYQDCNIGQKVKSNGTKTPDKRHQQCKAELSRRKEEMLAVKANTM